MHFENDEKKQIKPDCPLTQRNREAVEIFQASF